MTVLIHCFKCGKDKPESEFYKTCTKQKKAHRSYCKECMSKFQKEHGKEHSIATTKYLMSHPHRGWASSVMASHKRNGYIINVTLDEIEKLAKETTHCPLCGRELDYTRLNKDGKNQYNSPSLDRIDNDNHLSSHNTWIICKECNTTKGSRTLKEFKEYCKKIGGI